MASSSDRTRFAWTLLGVLLLASCGGDTAPAPERVEAVATAKAAAKALGERLVSRLGEAVAAGGPAAAIAVCRDEAPEIAAEVGRERGVGIGRTSHRLRNPENGPPDWAADLVSKMAEDPGAASGPRVFDVSPETVGVTLPIPTKKMCTTCHGAEEEIPADVRSALEESYPDDEARGFAEGDLRGLFWVEIPR